MLVNRSAPSGPIVPILVYDDVEKAIDWLCKAFGFTERLRTAPEPDGTIHHAQLNVAGGSVILTGRPTGERNSPSTPAPHSKEFAQSLYVQIREVDKHFERAKQFGSQILSEPKSTAFGERQYSARDLAGYRWTFSQSVADVSPEEWGAKTATIKNWGAQLPCPRLCYLEIPAVDVHQSAGFYEKVFGWNIRNRDSARPSFDDATGYISGAWVTGRKISNEAGFLPYIRVDSIEAILTKVVEHGGEVVKELQATSPNDPSWFAAFRDSAGNVMGLYQEGSNG